MGELIEMGGQTLLDIDPDKILTNLKGKLNSFVLSGYDKNGELFFSSSTGDNAEALWLIKKFEQALLNSGDPEDLGGEDV